VVVTVDEEVGGDPGCRTAPELNIDVIATVRASVARGDFGGRAWPWPHR
jgi:hypothetical protein